MSRTSAHTPLPALSAPLTLPLKARVYARQYAALYHFRLRRLAHANGRLRKRAAQRWRLGSGAADDAGAGASTSKSKSSSKSKGKDDADADADGQGEGPSAGAHMLERLLDIRPGQMVAVCGVVYCNMRLKPDVLEDLTREQYLPPMPARTTYADAATDEVFLEDESGRVRLVGDGDWRQMLVTGIVCAVLGTETRAGDFDVADVIFPGLPPPNAGPSTSSTAKVKTEAGVSSRGSGSAEPGSWVALVSGLEVGDGTGDDETGQDWTVNALRGEMLAEWLRGEIGDEEERELAGQVSALVVAGNSCAAPAAAKTVENKAGKAKVISTTALDALLAELASAMDVFILPGPNDPASLSLPQQALHAALLPRAARWSGLHRETNPAWCGVGDCTLLGTAGQNVNDLFKYVEEGEESDRLRMAERTLEWGHVAPTAPDTLWCFPFTDRDPFLIEAAPHIYFVGDQPSFQTSLVSQAEGHDTRVVLLPSFRETGTLVLVHTSTLETRCIQLGLQL